MSGSRTEPATQRRRAEARRRGDVPVSRELSGALALLAGGAALQLTGPALLAALARELRAGLASALDPGRDPAAALLDALATIARLSAPTCLAAATAGALGAALQAGFLFAPGAATPRLDRLDPARGLARLLAPAQLLGGGLGAAKAALVGWTAVAWVRGAAPALAGLARSTAVGPSLARLLAPLAARLGLLLLALGAADLALVRLRHRLSLRMTRDEVRREQREEEGDPRHRAERRRLHRGLLEGRPVARASCVVINPTHLAVALLHRRELGEAPRVVAKGAGAAARRIRSEARRAGVPVVRDVALARALHRLSEVGDEIPEELYDAAAAVLAHLHASPAARGAP